MDVPHVPGAHGESARDVSARAFREDDAQRAAGTDRLRVPLAPAEGQKFLTPDAGFQYGGFGLLRYCGNGTVGGGQPLHHTLHLGLQAHQVLASRGRVGIQGGLYRSWRQRRVDALLE
nr:hypothetical protein [Streptomyces sp. S1D4-11]QIY93081.1 hypothetical protein HEP87_01160 [Streptomyces sp. S1D4-11]